MGNYIFRLWALFTFRDSERYFLTFTQGFETIGLNGAEVYKDVWSGFLLNKTKSF